MLHTHTHAHTLVFLNFIFAQSYLKEMVNFIQKLGKIKIQFPPIQVNRYLESLFKDLIHKRNGSTIYMFNKLTSKSYNIKRSGKKISFLPLSIGHGLHL